MLLASMRTTKSRQHDLQLQNLVISKGVERILTNLFLSNPETQQFFHSSSGENRNFYDHGILHKSGWLSAWSKRKCFACSVDMLKLTRWWRSPCIPNQHSRTVVITTAKRHWKSLHSMTPQWLIEKLWWSAQLSVALQLRVYWLHNMQKQQEVNRTGLLKQLDCWSNLAAEATWPTIMELF